QALLSGLDLRSAARWPSTAVAYGYRYGRSGDDQTLAEATGDHAHGTWNHEPGVDLQYELDMWGRVAAGIAAARANADAARAAEDLLRTTVAAQTSHAYAQACAYGARARVQRHSIDVL